MTTFRLAALALLGLALAGHALAQTPTVPPQPPLAAGPATAADRIFYEEIRKAIATNDETWFGTAIRYPLHVTLRSGSGTIANAKDFTLHFSEIIDAAMRTAFTLQDENDLMRTPNGIPVGGGRLWFEPVYITAPGMATQRYYITAINN